MRETVTTDYIAKVDEHGNYNTVYGEVFTDQLEVLPDYGFPVLKSLNLRSMESRLDALHDHAVSIDDSALITMIADVREGFKAVEKKFNKYKTKIEHIKHELEEM